VKNRPKKCERSKSKTLLYRSYSFFFEDNKTHYAFRKELDKVVIANDDNNAGVWGGRIPQSPKANAEKIFTIFPKKYAF